MSTGTLYAPREQSNEALTVDPRWQLVQRIVCSAGLRRATHLKKILLFVAERSLLHPDDVIHEGDIAQGVLGRRDDFDPAYDTIVRVQIGHLRSKLQAYFEGEGATEPLRLTLPRGSYRTVFDDAPQPPMQVSVPVLDVPPQAEAYAEPQHGSRWQWMVVLVVLLCIALAGLVRKTRHPVQPNGDSTAQKMFPFLAKGGGKVAIVLPDTSLLLLQKTLNTEIPLETYTQTTSRDQLALQADDAKLASTLELLGRVRTTTLDEASVGMDFMQSLTRAGMQGELRYARDLHIRDLGQGSYILIGNQRSDPWVTLFSGHDNFQYTTGQPLGQHYSFRNLHPQPGEPAEYAPIEGKVESVNYADITLTRNLTDSGYVLMIIGSDVPANEAAARFLMGNDLPPELEHVLRSGSFRSLEILLSGHHLHGESNDKLAIVASRVTSR